jgi:uncharacterized iron-regulated protein
MRARAQAAPPQTETHAQFRAFDARGRSVTLAEIVRALEGADAVLVGEVHNDATGHRLEAELLRAAHAHFGGGAETGAAKRRRALALSLEMFERDVQTVLDEYLAGLISERHFLLSSRPWNNYQTDYRPLVEFAREHKLAVIASNAPARYVSRVSTHGPASLAAISQAAKAWLAPLPYAPASQAYRAKFETFMRGGHATGRTPQTPGAAQPHGAHGNAAHLLEAQTLRDATMAHTIAEHLRKNSNAFVFHVNGKFHSEERLGVAEQLARYLPKARVLVITIQPDDGSTEADAARLGDFVILTR